MKKLPSPLHEPARLFRNRVDVVHELEVLIYSDQGVRRDHATARRGGQPHSGRATIPDSVQTRDAGPRAGEQRGRPDRRAVRPSVPAHPVLVRQGRADHL